MADFVFLIKAVGGELEFSLVSENPAGTQKNRRNGNSGNPRAPGGTLRKDFIKAERDIRSRPGQSEPDFVGPHLPIILVDDPGATIDNVEFRCEQPFVIDVEIDLIFTRPAGASSPRSPFHVQGAPGSDLFPTPKSSVAETAAPPAPIPPLATHVVRGTLKKGNDGPRNHMFYKCTIWSNGLKLDPDMICDR